jgi:crotonobetainyl-CoA:carnitine CoA-transferase CaiB-like acyl-CoA transferase
VLGVVNRWPARDEAAERLQTGGGAAGPILRVNDLPADPHLAARELFGELHQPQTDGPISAEKGPARFTRPAEPAARSSAW